MRLVHTFQDVPPSFIAQVYSLKKKDAAKTYDELQTVVSQAENAFFN